MSIITLDFLAEMQGGPKSKHLDLPGQGNMGGARHGTAQATPLVATSHPDGKDRPVLAAPHSEPSARYTIPKKKKVGEKEPETSTAPQGDTGGHGAGGPAPDRPPQRPSLDAEGAAGGGGGL